MSNRNGDIIPDSRRREAIGAIGEDSYLAWLPNTIKSAAEVQIVNPQVGADTIDLEGIALIGKVTEGQIIVVFGDVYRVLNEVEASGSKMTGVKIYPGLRDIVPYGDYVSFYPKPEWRKWSEVVDNNSIGGLTPTVKYNS